MNLNEHDAPAPAAVPAPDALFGTDQERKDRNASAAERKGLEPCATCGKGVKPGNGWMVEVVDGGAMIAKPGQADESDSGYMGCWVLGPECGKHVPAGYRVKWNGWEE